MTDGGVTTVYKYYYRDGKLIDYQWSGTDIYIWYDGNGAPYGFSCNYTDYYYIKNAQGDIIGITDAAGNPVVAYSYDAWGRLLDTAGTLASTIGAYNPLRYRGYVYDPETGLYYLQSRYYDPEMGRFISADAYVSTGQGFVGNNMFVYCNNDPTNALDLNGKKTYAFIITLNATFGGGIAVTIAYVWDDKGNKDIQMYKAAFPSDDSTEYFGLVDAGVSIGFQETNANTVLDLYGPSISVGASGGFLGYASFDLIFFSEQNFKDANINGFQLSFGLGIGFDAHYIKTKTEQKSNSVSDINLQQPIDQSDISTSPGGRRRVACLR